MVTMAMGRVQEEYGLCHITEEQDSGTPRDGVVDIVIGVVDTAEDTAEDTHLEGVHTGADGKTELHIC